MLDSLGLQLTLWLLAAIGSVVAVLRYKQLREQIREKEARLPEACDYIDLSARIETARAELADASARVDEARALVESGARAKAEEQAARNWLTEKQDELLRVAAQVEEQERLKQELDARQAQLSEVESTRRSLVESNERLAQENRVLESRLSETQRILASFESTQSERETKLESLAGLIRKAENDLSQLNRDVAEFMDRAGKAEKEADRVEALCAAAQQQLDALQKEMATQRAELETLKASRKAHEEHIAMLKSLLEKTEKRLDQHNEQAGRVKSEDRYRDLWQPVSFPTLTTSAKVQDERECLERVERYLKGAGLQFPQRVVYAFHTALKVAEHSPMVVLAGISGTGKSELPRRYAEAMGIHFVGIAVQPRWDSPQDLFGFFNYMEGRYKATELARAMVQFEMFNRGLWPMPADRKGTSLKDQMLLVLLDEMNLARVEYYFSEFLSKLEVRRGIDEAKSEERAKAEIGIDMGSLGRDESPIRFYPGSNVLFAGTMNEDESTQSLSDKVLDRACVLRFGRPRQAGETSRREVLAGHNVALDFKNWEAWQKGRTLAAEDVRRVDRWVRELNEAMDALGRPFGHRVALAIRSYVALYPELRSGGQDRVQLAFADQIEQRILPKLRGIELDEAQKPIAAIRKVLQECDDPLLLAAFNQGAADRQTFMWRGLDRTE